MQTDSVTPIFDAAPAIAPIQRLRRSARTGLALYLSGIIAWLLYAGIRALGTADPWLGFQQQFGRESVMFVSLIGVGLTFFVLVRATALARSTFVTGNDDYRQVFDGNVSPLLVYEPESLRVLQINPAASAFFACSGTPPSVLTLEQLWDGTLSPGVGEAIAAVRAHPQHSVATIAYRLREDGSSALIEVRDDPLRYRSGAARLITLIDRSDQAAAPQARDHPTQGNVQDVAEHRYSRQRLREHEQQFRELVRVLPDGVVILCAERVLHVNSTGASQFGDSSDNLIGETLQSLVEPADLPQVYDYLQRAHDRRDTPAPLAPRMRRRDGSSFRAGISAAEVRYGEHDCTLLIIRDLTEPERTREALQTSNRELQAMAARLFSLQEDERRAISRDLHDDVGQAITAMKLSAYAAIEETDPERRQDDLRQITAMADTTIAKLRNLSMLLRPPQLDALGLEAALRWQAAMLFRSSSVALIAEIEALPKRPSNMIEQACFRIAQESLTNALRHAHASQVELLLDDEQGQQLRLQIIDDGEGFEPSAPRGLGLIVMRERAQAAGGTLQIRSSPGSGTHIDLQLPYHPSATAVHETAGY